MLLDGIADGLSLLTCERETFAYADSYDEAVKRYRGLRAGTDINLNGSTGLIVKPDAARQQMAAETPKAETPVVAGITGTQPSMVVETTATTAGIAAAPAPAPAVRPRRFHVSVVLDPTRVGRDAGRIADEVISHLAGLVGSRVTVTLEVQADV